MLDNNINKLGVTDRLVSLSPYTVDSCLRKAVVTCTDSSTNFRESRQFPSNQRDKSIWSPYLDAHDLRPSLSVMQGDPMYQ